MGWAGIENGALLALAGASEFDALLTKDAALQYEQNLINLPIAVVVLHAATNDLDDLRPLIPELLQTLNNVVPRTIAHVR